MAVAVVGRGSEMTRQANASTSRESLGNLLAPSLPTLADASRRLRRRPGRPRKQPRAVASQASAPLAASPLTRENARAVAEVWPIPPRLLGLKDAAKYAGVSSWTIRGWQAAGVLERVRLPGASGGELERLLFDRLDLDALIEAGKGQP